MAATHDHGLPGQVPSPHAPRSEISRSGVPLTSIYSKVIGFPGFFIFGVFPRIFEYFVLVLGFKIDSKLFLELLPSSWVPGKPGFVLPGSFRGLVCSKIQFPNSPYPDSNRI